MSNSRLRDLLNLSIVPRWSIVPHIRPQSVAEHSYCVAVIALEIARRLNGDVTPSAVVIEYKIMKWALVHDGPEAETGDMPYPAKKLLDRSIVDKMEADLCPWYSQEQLSIHPPERAVVKIADKVEEMLFLTQWGANAFSAFESARDQVVAHVEAARSRYGWGELPAIVEDVVGAPLFDVILK